MKGLNTDTMLLGNILRKWYDVKNWKGMACHAKRTTKNLNSLLPEL